MTIVGIRTLESRAIGSYAHRTADLAVFRMIYAAFILASVVPIAPWLSSAPSAFFYPPLGLAAIFRSTPPASVMIALNLILTLFAAMLLVGWKTRIASVGTGLLLLSLSSWRYSLGKINHDILLVVTPLVLVFTDWGRFFSIDSTRSRQSVGEMEAAQERDVAWPMALFALLIGFSMFTSGWAKATSGWLDPSQPCSYGHMINNWLSVGRETWFAKRAIWIQSLWFWKLADWSVVALEIAFLPAALHRRSFCLIAGIATVFHLGVMLVMNIPFPANVLAYGAFVRYSELPWFRNLNVEDPPSQKNAMRMFLASLALGSLAACGGKSVSVALRIPLDKVVVWAGAIVATMCLVQSLRGRREGQVTGASVSSGFSRNVAKAA